MIRRVGIIIFAAALLPPAAGFAFTSNGQQSWARWTASDRCAQAAQRAYPDFTAESNAKRDATYKNCLASSNLPPRSLDNNPAKP